LDCTPTTGEITYGLERLAMYLQGVESVYDLVWADGPRGRVTYRDVFHQNEVEQSAYNFEHADVAALLRRFDEHEQACNTLLEARLALPAYEQVLKASHTFNLLDARKAISVTERQRYILRVRTLARAVAQSYYASREALGFPMCATAAAGEVTALARAISWSSCAPKSCRRRRCGRWNWPSAMACCRASMRRAWRKAPWPRLPRPGGWPCASRTWPSVPRTRPCSGADHR
jgi:hypothetical protein